MSIMDIIIVVLAVTLILRIVVWGIRNSKGRKDGSEEKKGKRR